MSPVLERGDWNNIRPSCTLLARVYGDLVQHEAEDLDTRQCIPSKGDDPFSCDCAGAEAVMRWWEKSPPTRKEMLLSFWPV